MLDTGFTPPAMPPRHTDMCDNLLQIVQSSEKAHIEKQVKDQAKNGLEWECS